MGEQLPKFGSLVVTAMLLGSLAGCGTIFNGTRQDVQLQSSPSGAMVQVDDGGQTYTTPTNLNLERKNSYTLTFSKEGYEDATLELQRNMNGGILVLDILAGLVGVIVDAVTGGWYNLDPESATVTLIPADPDDPALTVSVAASGGSVALGSDEPIQVTVERR